MQTLSEFVIEKQHQFPHATGELTALLAAIKLSAKLINREINKSGLMDNLGKTDFVNVQGEAQTTLDVYANEVLKNALEARQLVAGIASEEDEGLVIFENKESQEGKYVVLMDPLDGSSNIDVNVSVGTIFSIYHRVTPIGERIQEIDFLQPGRAQVAAGYVIYGSSTMLVYTTGHGVNGFTYDPSIGEFCLSHPDMQFPKKGNMYSINEGFYLKFPQGVKKYLKYCQEEKDDRPYTSRYIGSLVADFHRNLLKGGIYIYPETTQYPTGKLRLLYECNPMAFIAEQAGGKASNGKQAILDIKPSQLHERMPFYVGVSHMVSDCEAFLEEYK